MALERKNLDLEEENASLRKVRLNLQTKYDEAQEQVTELERKTGIFAKYSFKPYDGISYTKDRNRIHFCTTCLFNFDESPLDNRLRCPKCKAQYEDRQ